MCTSPIPNISFYSQMVLFAITRGEAAVTLVRRALLIVGALYLGRVPYIFLTVLPAPWRHCFTPIDPNFGRDSWKLFSGQRVDCGDTFYSGWAEELMGELLTLT